MVTLLITSVFVIGLIVIAAVYFRQKFVQASQSMENPLPPKPSAGLFADYQPAQLPTTSEEPHNAIIELAKTGDTKALHDAHAINDRALYDEVLNTFVSQIHNEAQLLSLVSHVTRNELPVNTTLAQKSIDYWRGSLDRNATAKLLHIAALSDDADIYGQAVEVVLNSWREGKLPDVSAVELQALFNGEFWLLSSNTRSSGAGFVLKRTLSTAKRELELTNNPI
jgi:hypothetical protein